MGKIKIIKWKETEIMQFNDPKKSNNADNHTHDNVM